MAEEKSKLNLEKIEREHARRANVNVIYSMKKTLARFYVQSELINKEFLEQQEVKALLDVLEGFEDVIKKLKEIAQGV